MSNPSLVRLLITALWCALPTAACAVDLEGYTFDDDALAVEKAKDDPPEGTSEECIEFCNNQEEICGFGTDISYASKQDCFELCNGYLEPELSCFENHLDFARESPEAHCRHTLEDGGGDGTCPDASRTSCDRFCLRAQEACGFDEDDSAFFPNFRGCRDTCNEFTEGEKECRFGELTKAEEGEEERCLELLPAGGSVCDR